MTSGDAYGGEDNESSWRHIHQFLGYYKKGPNKKWARSATAVIRSLEKLGLNRDFRIGQSMFDIILSTKERHGLVNEPRVTLSIEDESKSVRVIYSRTRVESVHPVKKAVEPILGCLRDLWVDTKPGLPLPDGLRL